MQDCHGRAWDVVGQFMKENLTQFVGKTTESDSVMASSRSWLRNQSTDLGGAPEDHGIFLFFNIPALGVMSAARTSFALNYITQVMADHPLNAVCILVHANRASQQEGRMGHTPKHYVEYFVFLQYQHQWFLSCVSFGAKCYQPCNIYI